jgi:AcrR family transcriptional regulator
VTRATFYNHFPGKEDLVQAYLQDQDDSLRALFAEAGARVDSPAQLIDAALDGIAEDITRNHTRGCPFINAAAEYPDANSPVRQTVRAHRDWFRDTLEQIITAAGLDDPAPKAESLVLLRDAALVGGYLDGAAGVREAFLRTARLALR